MAAWRRAIELSLGEADTAKSRSIAQSRTEPASRWEPARILLAYREDPSFFRGRLVSLVLRKGRNLAIPTNCGQRGFWPATLASMDPRRDTRASPTSPRAQCARSFDQEEVKPHKVRYYLEQRDPDFAEKNCLKRCAFIAK